jgi:hypothetical protein
MTCSPAGWWLVESLPDGEADDLHNIGVRHDIHVTLALAPGADQAGKLELARCWLTVATL